MRLLLILDKTYGRLGNQLFLFAHVLGSAIEHGLTVLNPAFADNSRYFEAWHDNPLCRYPLPPQSKRHLAAYGNAARCRVYFGGIRRKGLLLASGMIHRLRLNRRRVAAIRLTGEQPFDLSSPEFVSAARLKYLFLRGWLFRDMANVTKHADAIRALFRPLEPYRLNVTPAISHAREAGDFLIGVHIRRGDYRTFNDGKFFYSVEQYRQFMEQASRLFPEKRTAFLVCSDEAIPADAWGSLRVIAGPGMFIEDMYALAECDAVIGPPSTFSAWASYYGNKPLLHLQSPDEVVAWDRFAVFAG